MISIIICSANKSVLEKAIKSITDTIGVAFETIVIENSAGQFGICDAYNQGAAKAKYDIFCFMHEDISFETIGWGERVIAHLQDISLGLIGIAGGETKSLVPSSWASSVFENEISLIQHFKDPNRESLTILKTATPENKSLLKPVVCIDGVWMCTRREVFKKYQFDPETFSGFHGYDIDFSLQVFNEYKVAVVFDILIHHYSEGTYGRACNWSQIFVTNKWRKKLPKSVKNLSRKTLIDEHWTSMKVFLEKLIELNYSLPLIIKYFLRYSFVKYFYWKHFLHCLKYIFLEYFRRKRIFTNI
ncbi:MAG TPA: glycosyltransferase [Chitinophagaceae bacterium]|nr:glycosyltransferase [Chitinophagaceae bacterium]